MEIQESGEMYLETILVLSQRKSRVRSIDIAEEMGFSKPSVSRAMSRLKELHYVTMDTEDSHIELTDEGRAIAEKIYERHTLLTSFFMKIGVDEENASNDACRIEHVISDVTFEAIKNHVKERS